VEFMDPSSVVDDTTLIAYVRQHLGCPGFKKDEIIFRRASKEYRDLNPHISYPDLVRVVDWCKATHRRPPTLASIFRLVGFAYQAGILRSVETHRERLVMNDLYAALAQETDPVWRRRLLDSSGPAQRKVLAAWKARKGA